MTWELALAMALLTATPVRADRPTLRCPMEMARLGATCVDRWEASLVVVGDGGARATLSPYRAPSGELRYVAVSRPGVVPQAHVSMSHAWLACRRAGKRLCKADEWVAACRGPADDVWPYGAAREPGRCVDAGRTAPLERLYSGAERFENRNMNDPRLDQLPNTVARTGEAAGCTNDLGVFDMVGNLNEWIDDTTMRGGFYLDVIGLGAGCGYATRAHSHVYADYSTGFRCCADATLDDAPALDAAALIDACVAPFEEGARSLAELLARTTQGS